MLDFLQSCLAQFLEKVTYIQDITREAIKFLRMESWLLQDKDEKMQINKDIWDKAVEIRNRAARLEEYLIDCREASICPHCGENMKYKIALGNHSTSYCGKCGKTTPTGRIDILNESLQ